MAALAAVALVLTAPPAHAGGAASPTGPSDDGSCETRPTGYPADGEPVPDSADCALIVGADAAVIGEVWSWGDVDSIQWYNYPVFTLPPAEGGTVIMCGSTDPGAAGVEYLCTAESTYLLFTVSGIFVGWPAALSDPLHFCEQVTFGTGSTAVVGSACSSVQSEILEDDPILGGTGPTQTQTAPTSSPSEPPSSPPPTGEATSPTVEPSQTTVPGDEPAGGLDEPAGGETSADGSTPTGSQSPVPTTTIATAPSLDPEPGATGPTGPPARPDLTGPAVATPVAGSSVAVVGGSRFPMGFVLVLALALALGGYVTLAAPGLAAARRRRR